MQSPEYMSYEELLEEVKNGPHTLNGFTDGELQRMLTTASGLTLAALRDVLGYRQTIQEMVARERKLCPKCRPS